MSFFETYLKGDPEFLVCGQFTLADISLSVVLFFLQRSGATLKDYPHIAKYAEAMTKQPALSETWPPHWKTSEPKTFMAPFL